MSSAVIVEASHVYLEAAKTAFRTFVHPVARMQAIIAEAGFDLVSRETTLIWSADVT
jgi:hypothetical protein